MTQYGRAVNLVIDLNSQTNDRAKFLRALVALDELLMKEVRIIDDGTLTHETHVKMLKVLNKAWEIYSYDLKKVGHKPCPTKPS
jgi:hypothetical protein